MGSFGFNNVKAEKVEAMKRYNRQKKFKSFLFVLEVLAALAFLSWSSYTYFSVAVEKATDFLRQAIAVFGQSLVVLIIVNFLILLILASSCQRSTTPDFYDEYVTIAMNVSHRSVTTAEKPPAPEETVSEKHIVCVDKAVNSPVVAQNIASSVTMTDREAKQKHAVSSVEPSTVGAVSEPKKYRRTRSERLEREKQRELRRSDTVVKREMVVFKGEPARRSSAMDDLSNEEFKLTIETFIASQKKTLIRENTLDLKLERNQCVAITLSALN